MPNSRGRFKASGGVWVPPVEPRPSRFRYPSMEEELSEILGRRVDLNTPNSLSKYFRDEVLEEAEEVYVQTR
jgi:predicted nucleotidyltransferase